MDYRDAKSYPSEKAAREAGGALSINAWWALGKKQTADRNQAFIDQCLKVKNASTDREQANIRHARLYENVEVNSLTSADYATSIVRQTLLGTGLMTLNVTAAAIDTLAAKISKNKPRPSFQTSGGSWKSQMKARRLDKFMRGVFYEVDIYEKAKQAFIDAEVMGTGFLHAFKNDDGRLEFERVMPSELFVDDADGLFGKPRQLLRRKLVQREVLAALFPTKAEEILSAPRGNEDSSTVTQVMVEVWEGWHLPSSKKAGDGKRIIAINGCELLCEEWKLETFPFVVLRSKPRVVGFWGKGTAEALVGIQLELNRLIRSISEQLRRKGRNQVFLQHGSKVNPAHMTNAIGDIVWYTGAPPTFNNNNAVSQEDYMQVDRLYQRAFQEVGVSELSAASKKPSGLDAGVALREFSEIESERFSLKHQAWDTLFNDVAKLVINLITKQYPDLQKGYAVKLPSRRRAIEIDWKDIQLDEDSYVMQIFPTSSLPQTPAARKQFVKELQADGMISPTVAKRLLDFPDVEAEMDLGNAALDDVDATISAILDEEKPVLMPPEPFQNLELLVERAQANYLMARHFQDIEPERLEMLRSLAEMAANMLAPPPVPAALPGAPASAVPPVPAGGASLSGGVEINNAMNVPPTPAVPPLVAA